MQEAFFGGWPRESARSSLSLGSLRDLNQRFLDLAAAPAGWLREGRVPAHALGDPAAPLSAAQRAAAADCPYALFDLGFRDVEHWCPRLADSGVWRVAETAAAAPAAAPDPTVDFARLALFYAWHLASGTTLRARLLLGMSDDTAAALRAVRVNQLGRLAASNACRLGARFDGCPAFWTALIAAASSPDAGALRRVQLYGLQIAAASAFPGS